MMFCVCRGHKAVCKSFSTEVSDLEPVMALLCQQQVDTHFPSILSLYGTALTIELDVNGHSGRVLTLLWVLQLPSDLAARTKSWHLVIKVS